MAPGCFNNFLITENAPNWNSWPILGDSLNVAFYRSQADQKPVCTIRVIDLEVFQIWYVANMKGERLFGNHCFKYLVTGKPGEFWIQLLHFVATRLFYEVWF